MESRRGWGGAQTSITLWSSLSLCLGIFFCNFLWDVRRVSPVRPNKGVIILSKQGAKMQKWYERAVKTVTKTAHLLICSEALIVIDWRPHLVPAIWSLVGLTVSLHSFVLRNVTTARTLNKSPLSFNELLPANELAVLREKFAVPMLLDRKIW